MKSIEWHFSFPKKDQNTVNYNEAMWLENGTLANIINGVQTSDY